MTSLRMFALNFMTASAVIDTVLATQGYKNLKKKKRYTSVLVDVLEERIKCYNA